MLVETTEEKRLFALGEQNYNAKKALAKKALRKQAPNDEESDLIHAMWIRQIEYHGENSTLPLSDDSSSDFQDPNISTRRPDNVIYMDSTVMHSSQIMQPQYRNRHNFMIFGGFLLKQTFELAFCCAAAFSHTRPRFLSLDPSTFENPVPVGSVLYLTATVAYTDPPLLTLEGSELSTSKRGDSEGAEIADGKPDAKFTRVQIRIDSKVRNVEHGETKPTGQVR